MNIPLAAKFLLAKPKHMSDSAEPMVVKDISTPMHLRCRPGAPAAYQSNDKRLSRISDAQHQMIAPSWARLVGPTMDPATGITLSAQQAPHALHRDFHKFRRARAGGLDERLLAARTAYLPMSTYATATEWFAPRVNETGRGCDDARADARAQC